MLEKTSIRSLSQNEMDEIKIVLNILEGYDTLDYIARYTKIPKSRATYLLSILKKAGLVYKKDETKRWRVRVNYFRVWKSSKYIYEKETVSSELEPIKQLRELEEQLTNRKL